MCTSIGLHLVKLCTFEGVYMCIYASTDHWRGGEECICALGALNAHEVLNLTFFMSNCLTFSNKRSGFYLGFGEGPK